MSSLHYTLLRLPGGVAGVSSAAHVDVVLIASHRLKEEPHAHPP